MSVISAMHKTGLFSKLFKSFVQNLPLHPRKLKVNLTTSIYKTDMGKKKTFNTPYPPKDPPENYNPSYVLHNAFEAPDFVPTAIFRPFTSNYEILGPGADKRGCYKNPEYFSYHRFSFALLQFACLKLCEQRKKNANIRCLYDIEDSDDGKFSSDENKN